MAWFDDPRKELNRLQEQLLAEEEPEEMEDFDEEYPEDEPEPLYRNHANGYGVDIRNFANGYRGEALLEEEEAEDWEENDDEPYALFYEDRRARRRRLRKEKAERKKKRKDRRNDPGRLKLIILLETLVILGVLILWVVKQWL